MKLKKKVVTKPSAPATASAPEDGGVAIAGRFRLDADPLAGKPAAAGVNRKAAMVAMFGALLALTLLGVITFMLYTNWELVKNV